MYRNNKENIPPNDISKEINQKSRVFGKELHNIPRNPAKQLVKPQEKPYQMRRSMTIDIKAQNAAKNEGKKTPL